MKSIIQKNKECWFCHTDYGLHLHHIYHSTALRKISDKNGFVVYLCGYHHNLSKNSVHYNKEMDLELKRICQQKYESMGNTRSSFISLIGKNYL